MDNVRAAGRFTRRFLSLAGLGVITITLALCLRRVPWHAIRSAFASADATWIGCAVPLTFVNIALRGLVLRTLIRPAAQISILRAIRYTIASMTASIIAPFRAGEAVRAWLLVRCEGITVPACAGIYACEKIGDAAALLVLSAPLPWLLPNTPRWIGWCLGSLAVALILVATLLMFARGAAWGARIRRRIAPIGMGRTLAPAALAILMVWVVDLLTIMAVLRAVGAPGSAPIAAFVLLAVNIAISVPSPANGGTLELGAVVALQALGADPGKAFAFAVLYHSAQVLPILAIGIAGGPTLWQTAHSRLTRSSPRPTVTAEPPTVTADTLSSSTVARA